MAQHPAISHAMILREVRLLRESFEVYTASIRPPDRPDERLSPDERDERQHTYYIKPAGLGCMLRAVVAAFLAHPFRFAIALWYAISLARFRLKQLPLNLAYFGEAAMVGIWMRRLGLTHLHTHYSSTVALLVHRAFGLNISVSFHGPDEFNDPVGFWIPEKIAACTFVRAISQYARGQLMKSSAVADWGKIQVVYMGVDSRAFPPRPFRRDPSTIEILCVGRLAPAKAQHILIGAIDLLVREHQPIRLNVVGDGPDRQSLAAEVSKRKLEAQVIFHGFTSEEKLQSLYGQADIFALPSFAEGVPGVLMEAMAMEIPCVATWIAGIPELIRSGVDGLLVAPSDIEELASALRQLITDPDLRLRLGQSGRRRVLEKFDLQKNGAALAKIFEASL